MDSIHTLKQQVKEGFTLVIDSTNQTSRYMSDLIRYRELFYFLAWRDILVRYRQAFFGVSWALFKPLLSMLLFTLVFGKIAELPSGHVNYALFVLAGLLPWQLFANSVTETTLALINHANLVSKIYFPRMIIPVAHIGVHLVDFFVGLICLVVLCLFYGEGSFWTFFLLPPFMFLTVLLCTGVSLWLSAATVQYRDFRFIVPFAIQFGVFVSPVGYGSAVIPQDWLWLYLLNPLVGIIDGFRWAFFNVAPPHFLYSCLSSLVVTTLILVSGFVYFRNMEKTFADKI